MSAEINAAIQSLMAVYNVLKTRKELADSNELQTAVNDVLTKLTQVTASALASQEKQGVLAERVRDLETQLREVEDWNTQIQRYELVEFPDTKALALKLKAEMASGEPTHYLCRACSEKKKKTTLQPSHIFLECPECKSSIQTQIPLPKPRRTQISGGSDSWMG